MVFLDQDLDIGSVVDELVGGYKCSPYITSLTSPLKKQGKGGGPKPKIITNPFRQRMEGYHYQPMPSWLDDVLYGSQRAHSGNTVVPQNLIFTILTTYGTFSTMTVLDYLNKKRHILGEDLIGKRYAELVVASCRNAINAIQYQLDSGKVWCEVSPLTTSLTSQNFEV